MTPVTLIAGISATLSAVVLLWIVVQLITEAVS